jgi:hypothetical protein
VLHLRELTRISPDEAETRSDHYQEYDYHDSRNSSEGNESVDSEDGDDKPHSTPASSFGTAPRRSTWPPSSKPRTLRRRPHLIFDKTPPRGFKKLTPNSKTKKTPVSRKERPGDGFSDGEARPEGLVQILGKRRLPPSAISGAGALDLTQSSPIVKPKPKPRKKVKRVEDNSFYSTPRGAKRLSERNPKKKKASLAARDTPERRLVPETVTDTTESVSAPYGAGPNILVGDTPEQEQQGGQGEETRKSNEHRRKWRVQDGSDRGVGRTDNATISDPPVDSRAEHPIFPFTQPPDQGQVEVSPAKTWDTYIEESSPFGQRCSSDEVVQILVEREGPVTGRRVFRREKTA